MPETKPGQGRKQKKALGSSGARQYLSLTLQNNRLIAQVRRSTSSNSFFLAIVAICLLGFGIALIVIFGSKDNRVSDLILIGSIMLVAGVMFIIMFIVSVYRTVAGRRKVAPGSERDLINAEKNRQTDNRNIPDNGGMTCCDWNLAITPDEIEQQRKPSAVSLYGDEGRPRASNQDTDECFPPPIVLPVKRDSGDVIEVPFAPDMMDPKVDEVFHDDEHKERVSREIKRATIRKEGSAPPSESNVIDLTASKQDGGDTPDFFAGGTDKQDSDDVLTSLYSDVQSNGDVTTQPKDHLLELGSKILQKGNAGVLKTEVKDISVDGDEDKQGIEASNTTNAQVLNSLCSDVDDNSYTMTTSTKNYLGELGSKILQKHNVDLTVTEVDDEHTKEDHDQEEGEVESDLRRISGEFRTEVDNEHTKEDHDKEEEGEVESDLRRISGEFMRFESANGTAGERNTPDDSNTTLEITNTDESNPSSIRSDWTAITNDFKDSKC